MKKDLDRVRENRICAKNWPALVDQAEQVAKDFAVDKNVTWPTKEINFSEYKHLTE